MLLSCLTNEHGFCWGRHHKWWPWWCSWSALIAHTCKSQVSANQMPRMIHMVILLELATGDRLVPSFQAVVSVFYSSIPCHTSTWHFVAYILETSWNKCIVAIQTKCRIQIETWIEINSFHVDFWEEATIMVNDQFFFTYTPMDCHLKIRYIWILEDLACRLETTRITCLTLATEALTSSSFIIQQWQFRW